MKGWEIRSGLPIDESVESALEKHQKVPRFHVHTARDLPDARIKGQKSARDR